MLQIQSHPNKSRYLQNNRGSATIMLSSYSNEPIVAEEDSSHSIHLNLKGTTFDSEVVDASIIENDGGRIQSSGSTFVNNSAESIIRSDHGTVDITSTEFTANDVRGEEGVIVLDDASALERSEDTCISNSVVSSTAAGGSSGMESFVERRVQNTFDMQQTQQEAETTTQPSYCKGVVSNGMCNSFEECNTHPSSGGPAIITPPSMGDCYSDWDTLVTAVKTEPMLGTLDFVICPQATLVATPNNPVIISNSYITISCGTESAPSNDCVITGGYSHFHIVEMSSGVQLARLSMSKARGASVMAFGSSGMTLNLRDCHWTMNNGASAILIVNFTSELTVGESTLSPLDVSSILSYATTAPGMSVEVSRCKFEKNEFTFGAIANIGGALSVGKTKFTENSGKGGDIVVTNQGSATVQESCFDTSSSVAPGVIFIERGSECTEESMNNFGVGVTAGGYGIGKSASCTGIFQEALDSDCLGSSACTGTCREFTALSCPVSDSVATGSIVGGAATNNGTPTGGGSGTSSSTDKDDVIFIPAHNDGENEEGGSIIPIVVAALVCAFIVFGLFHILFRRRKARMKKTQADNGDTENINSEEINGEAGERGGLFGRFKRKKGEINGDAYDEEQMADNVA